MDGPSVSNGRLPPPPAYHKPALWKSKSSPGVRQVERNVRFSDDLQIIPSPMPSTVHQAPQPPQPEIFELPAEVPPESARRLPRTSSDKVEIVQSDSIKEIVSPRITRKVTEAVRRQSDESNTSVERVSPSTLSLGDCLGIVGRWIISDYFVLILAILSFCLVAFALTIVIWAARNPASMCQFNPRLTKFHNGLWPAFVTILPGCVIALTLLPSMTGAKRKRSNRLSRCGWTRPRIFFTCLFVACLTLVVSPWSRDILDAEWRLSCAPYLFDGDGQTVTLSPRNYTTFCANVWKKNEDEFSEQAQAWKHDLKMPMNELEVVKSVGKSKTQITTKTKSETMDGTELTTSTSSRKISRATSSMPATTQSNVDIRNVY